ncbi:sulfatase-like hydrolase/transferase [Ulvibacterium marinum]|uniref:sulfatase-like hydrolase/transferase n=1 Tax=Ulvibacterium marinum TaxID=2419782 RepID=UPI002495A00F|nr:sulfatase-like hydrolase/transferase [Ulvibacterium marinum]
MRIGKIKHFRSRLGLIFSIVFFSAIGIFTTFGQEKPNFVFILTDDQSYGYMGCTGNPIVKTPHLDALAKEGVLFTNAHITSAICTPSRASILTSQFERKHGINFNSGTSMAEEAWEQTYPMVMRENGYYTGWIGKNHVPVGEGGYDSGIMESSFDYWYAGHGHLGFYPKERHEIFDGAKSETQVEVVGEGVYDFLSNEEKLEGALRFVEKRPENQPFMLSVCFNLPHSAGTSSMEMRETDDTMYKSLYRDMEMPLPNHYVAKKDIETPKLPPTIHKAEDRQTSYAFVDTPTETKERYVRQLQAMTGIDRLVGRLRKTLKEQNLDKNTIIVFTSDHGLFMGQFGLGGKALCYEVTTHVPLIIYDPTSKKSARGKKSEALVQSIDIAPTLLSMAGISAPTSYQGRDLTNILSGTEASVRSYLYTENLWSTHFGNPRCESVQNKEWKYIRYYKNENLSARKIIKTAKEMDITPAGMLYKVHDSDIAIYRDYVEGPLQGEATVYEELFNLRTDPDETTNLANDTLYVTKLVEMRTVWKKEIQYARGKGFPKVVRYTADSESERSFGIEPK